MSMLKYFGVIAMSATIASGCGPGQAEETDQLQQKGIIWSGNNTDVAIGAEGSGFPIRGLRLESGAWRVMTATSDNAATVTSITYNGLPVNGLSTTQGWLQVSTGRGVYTKVSGPSFSLNLQVGAPLNGTLRLSATNDAATFGRYTAQWKPNASTDWVPFCPHYYYSYGVDPQDIFATIIAEPVIPVGGAKWDPATGSRIDDSAAITLSCSHDAVGGCIEMDYEPWDFGSKFVFQNGSLQVVPVSLRDYHQACTRMKRADFCGNGESFTSEDLGVSHTSLSAFDAVWVHNMAPQTRDLMEAYWSTSGATCVNPTMYRRRDNPGANQEMLDTLASCPKPLCAGTTTSGLVGSARPCAMTDPNTGNCTAN